MKWIVSIVSFSGEVIGEGVFTGGSSEAMAAIQTNYHEQVQSTAVEPIAMLSVYQSELPQSCVGFQSKCEGILSAGWTSNVETMKTGFEACCIYGGHSISVCAFLGQEMFGSVVTTDFNIADHAGLCDEMMNLFDAHTNWQSEQQPGLLQSDSSHDEMIEDRARKAANHLLDAHEGRLSTGVPSLIEITPAFALALGTAAGPPLLILTQAIVATMRRYDPCPHR